MAIRAVYKRDLCLDPAAKALEEDAATACHGECFVAGEEFGITFRRVFFVAISAAVERG